MTTVAHSEPPPPRAAAYRGVSWVCLGTALAHVTAVLLSVYAIREGNLGDFSPLKIMHFIPHNLTLWRWAWIADAVASVSFLVFVVAVCTLLDRKLRPALTIALLLTTVGLTNDLNGQFSMMVLFSDLAQQMHGHGSFLQHETVQLAWSTMNQSLTQSVLIANTLYSISGIVLVVCGLLTRAFPKWLAWLGFPIWVATLNVTVFVFVGALKWALVLLLAATVGFVVWTTVMGLAFRMLSRSPAAV